MVWSIRVHRSYLFGPHCKLHKACRLTESREVMCRKTLCSHRGITEISNHFGSRRNELASIGVATGLSFDFVPSKAAGLTTN